MNLFFNPIKDLQNYANQLSGNNIGGKQQKLKTQLYHCTYNDEVKYVIEKSAKQVLHVYPYFDSDILTFVENGQQRRYLQLKGIMQIEVRGKMCKVDYNMMLPNGFPKKAPYVRIINRNAEYNVDNYYKGLVSPTDPKSFILNTKLNEIKSWDQSKSLVNVIIQSQDMLRNHFPFSKSNTNNQSGSSQWGSNSPWQNPNPNYNAGGFNSNPTIETNNNSGWVNNWGSNNNNNSGWANNQGWANNNSNQQQSGWGVPNQNNWGNNNNSNNSSWGSVGNKQPPIPFQGANVSETIAKAQKYVGQNKKLLQNMKNQKLKALDTIQHMQIIKQSIQSEQKYLRNENYEMTMFLQKSQSSDSEHNLSNIVRAADPLSEQILDVYSNIKAHEETVTFLENKFNEGSVSFEDFLKNLRKIQQDKFDEKALLLKCMSMMKNQA